MLQPRFNHFGQSRPNLKTGAGGVSTGRWPDMHEAWEHVANHEMQCGCGELRMHGASWPCAKRAYFIPTTVSNSTKPPIFPRAPTPVAPVMQRAMSASMIAEILLLVEQVGSRTAQVDDLGAAVAVLLQASALEAVESVGDSLAAAHDTLVLVVAEGAFVADADEGGGADVAVTDGALSIALVAEAADGDSGLLPAHNQIGMMAGHAG